MFETLPVLTLALVLPLLVVVAVTDVRHGIIPNAVNLAIGGLGVVDAAVTGQDVLAWRALDAGTVAVLLLLVRAFYRHWRGRVGLGLGDVKFLTAATLWLGMASLFTTLFLACVGALAFLGVLALQGRPVGRSTRLRFGPFLAASMTVVLIAVRFEGP